MLIKMARNKIGMTEVATVEPSVNSHIENPYGLRITLNKPELEKLGLSVEMFTIGDKLSLGATVEVIRVFSEAGQTGESEANVEFQLIEIDNESFLPVETSPIQEKIGMANQMRMAGPDVLYGRRNMRRIGGF